MGDASEPGRHDPADETKSDQTHCCSHEQNPPNHPSAIEMPPRRAREVRIQLHEMPVIVFGRTDRGDSRSSNFYRVVLTGYARLVTAGNRRRPSP